MDESHTVNFLRGFQTMYSFLAKFIFKGNILLKDICRIYQLEL